MLAGLTALLGGGGGGGGSFESIATVTAAGGETSFTFSSIPSTYKHLQIRGLARNTSATAGTAGSTIRFNGDTAANYSAHALTGNGTSASAIGFGSQTRIFLTSNEVRGSSISDTFGACIIDVIDYASTTKNKTVRAFDGGDINSASPSGAVTLDSGLWMSTSAVTSLTITVGATGFAAGTVFALYGIKG